ncbi:MAG TPA: hypothetical protein VNZ05_08430, partial [Solirubrobacteraceae bacterium]|nr:hypothetical protein [Solirubrobacteraceae bacterium]
APNIAKLLSPQTRELEEASLLRYTSIAQQGETPFRLDETNNVSCGGVAGVSNTFAGALWAAGYLPRAMTLGVSGVNLHGLPASCTGYAPVCAPTPEALAAGALGVQPEWYALLLIKALVGERPLPTLTASPRHPNVLAAATLGASGALHFVLVDDDPPGSHAVAMRLRVGAGFAGASVLRLTAPAPQAVSGMLLGGRPIAPDGSWSAPARLPQARSRRGVVTVRMAPSSAALVSVAPQLATAR